MDRLRTAVSRRIPHRVIYGALCVLYLAACFGLGKVPLSLLVALCYLVLCLRK